MSTNSLVKWALVGAGVTAVLGLGGCVDGYGGGVGVSYAGGEPWAYDGYYDGFYGTDGFFYYRGGGGDNQWHKGAGNHFRRDAPGDGSQYRPIHGSGHPVQGGNMPHFPRGGGQNGHGGAQQSGHDSGDRHDH